MTMQGTQPMNNSDLEDIQEIATLGEDTAEAVVVGDVVGTNAGQEISSPQESETAAVSLRDEVSLIFKRYFENLEGETITDFYPLFLSEFEPALFEAVMKFTRGNQTKAAAILSVNRGTLRKKLKIYGML